MNENNTAVILPNKVVKKEGTEVRGQLDSVLRVYSLIFSLLQSFASGFNGMGGRSRFIIPVSKINIHYTLCYANIQDLANMSLHALMFCDLDSESQKQKAKAPVKGLRFAPRGVPSQPRPTKKKLSQQPLPVLKF